MRTIRARLVALTLLLLAQQAVALAVAGALVCCETDAPRPAARMECCKDGGEGHMCPLGSRRAPDRECRIKSGCATERTGVLAGAGFVYAAPLVGRFSVLPPAVERIVWRTAVPDEVVANTPPPSPPPKG